MVFLFQINPFFAADGLSRTSHHRPLFNGTPSQHHKRTSIFMILCFVEGLPSAPVSTRTPRHKNISQYMLSARPANILIIVEVHPCVYSWKQHRNSPCKGSTIQSMVHRVYNHLPTRNTMQMQQDGALPCIYIFFIGFDCCVVVIKWCAQWVVYRRNLYKKVHGREPLDEDLALKTYQFIHFTLAYCLMLVDGRRRVYRKWG